MFRGMRRDLIRAVIAAARMTDGSLRPKAPELDVRARADLAGLSHALEALDDWDAAIGPGACPECSAGGSWEDEFLLCANAACPDFRAVIDEAE